MLRRPTISSTGITNRNQTPYPTLAIASPPITTAEVGVTRLTKPLAAWKAVTTR